MIRNTLKAIIGAALLVAGATAAGEQETPIPLDDVPAAALNAAPTGEVLEVEED